MDKIMQNKLIAKDYVQCSSSLTVLKSKELGLNSFMTFMIIKYKKNTLDLLFQS